jgi:hypothetical protein
MRAFVGFANATEGVAGSKPEFPKAATRDWPLWVQDRPLADSAQFTAVFGIGGMLFGAQPPHWAFPGKSHHMASFSHGLDSRAESRGT